MGSYSSQYVALQMFKKLGVNKGDGNIYIPMIPEAAFQCLLAQG